MARKRVRRTRKAVVRKSAPRRRRRRAVAVARTTARPVRRRRRPVFAANPPARRRRRKHAASGKRRRFRRNPGLVPSSARGIVGGIVQGLKDGAAIVGGQVAARKIRGAITGMMPAAQQAGLKSGAGYVGLSLVGAIITSIAAKKLIPTQARMITGGAFSEVINAGLAQTPAAAYLGAFGPSRRLIAPAARRGVAAWPGSGARPLAAGRTGMAAWPKSVGMPSNAGM